MKKLAEYRGMSIEQLKAEHRALLKEQFNLRMMKGTGQLTQTHQFKKVRRSVARILTLIKERKIQEATS